MITENIRQQYLQAMGIESYLPRWQLPGAAPSPVAMEDLLDDEPREPSSAETARPVSREPVTGSPLHARLNVDLEAKPPRVKTAVDTAATVVPQPRAPRFALGIWQISPQILVLDSRRPDLALPVGQLLQNIALALGLNGPPPELEVLRRPLADSGDFHESEADARAQVRAFLAARVGAQDIRQILLMGAPAIRFALHEEQLAAAGELRSLIGKPIPLQLEDLALQAIALPSLATILQRPELKPRVWSAIKHLRQH